MTYFRAQNINASFFSLFLFYKKFIYAKIKKKSRLNAIVILHLYKTNIRLFSDKIFRNLHYIRLVLDLKPNKIFNISIIIYKIRIVNYIILNPSIFNLASGISLSKTYYINIYINLLKILLEFG